MAKQKKEKKKGSGLGGAIIFLVAGIVCLLFGGDYAWVLLGVIEIPLQILGGIAVVLGLISLIVVLKNKSRKKKENNQ